MRETPVAGKLELIVGPMRSNETVELLRRIEIRRQYARQDVMLLKPSADTKALHPQRRIDGKPAPYESPIMMAGDHYEPRCAEHFVLPGRPHWRSVASWFLARFRGVGWCYFRIADDTPATFNTNGRSLNTCRLQGTDST